MKTAEGARREALARFIERDTWRRMFATPTWDKHREEERKARLEKRRGKPRVRKEAKAK